MRLTLTARLVLVVGAVVIAAGLLVMLQLDVRGRVGDNFTTVQQSERMIGSLMLVDRALASEAELIDVRGAGDPVDAAAMAQARNAADDAVALLRQAVEAGGDVEDRVDCVAIERLQGRLVAMLDGTAVAGSAKAETSDLLAGVIEAERREVAAAFGAVDDHTSYVLLTSLAVIVVLLAGVVIGVILPLRRRLPELVVATRRIAAGDLATPLVVAGPREVADVAREVDAMRIQLAAQKARGDADAQLLADRLAQLERANRAVESSDRMASIGVLAAGIAHEIANPMSYVLANVQFAREELDGAPIDPDVRAALADARGGADRVVKILHDLKTFSRGMAVEAGSFAVDRVIEQTLALTAGKVRSIAKVVRDDAPELPLAVGDDQRLAQVLLNLVMNSAQAFAAKDPANQIVIRTRRTEAWLAIDVEDNGCGIPADVLPRIFEPFYSTKPAGVGTGLGLSVCRNLVTAMGGTITARSQPGCTTVTVRLRIASQLPERVAAPSLRASGGFRVRRATA